MATHTVTVSLDGPGKLRLKHERIAADGTREEKDRADKIRVDRGDRIVWKSEIDDLRITFVGGESTNPFDPIKQTVTVEARRGQASAPFIVSRNALSPNSFTCSVKVGTGPELPGQVGVDTPGPGT